MAVEKQGKKRIYKIESVFLEKCGLITATVCASAMCMQTPL